MRKSSCAAIALCAAGCASQPPANAPEAPVEAISLHLPGDLHQAKMEGDRIYGPQIELERYPDSLRGRLGGGLVDLRSENDTIQGVIGRGRTELHVVASGDDGFRVSGLVHDSLSAFDMRSDRISGKIGSCQYDLRQDANASAASYRGVRYCGRRGPESAEFEWTPAIASLDPVQRAELLAIFLAN